MIDREKVVAELERVTNEWKKQHDDDFLYLEYSFARDALALLKEQQQQIWELQDQAEYLTDKQEGR